jgi:hypothetical protein
MYDAEMIDWMTKNGFENDGIRFVNADRRVAISILKKPKSKSAFAFTIYNMGDARKSIVMASFWKMIRKASNIDLV